MHRKMFMVNQHTILTMPPSNQKATYVYTITNSKISCSGLANGELFSELPVNSIMCDCRCLTCCVTYYQLRNVTNSYYCRI